MLILHEKVQVGKDQGKLFIFLFFILNTRSIFTPLIQLNLRNNFLEKCTSYFVENYMIVKLI